MLHAADAQDRLNDFVIKLANVNGTGSASANTLLMKSIFRMGIPVVGKNYFPSNIQGLPTWYEIRVTRDGYVARSGRVDVMVAMNAETYAKDVKEVSPGGYLLYDSTWPRPALLKRDDITILGAPFARMMSMSMSSSAPRKLAYMMFLSRMRERTPWKVSLHIRANGAPRMVMSSRLSSAGRGHVES